MGNRLQEKLLDLYKKTITDGELYEGDLKDINYYNLIFKAGTDDKLETWGDNNVCGYKYNHNGNDSVLIILSLPINSAKETSTSKNVAERIMDIVKNAEQCFTTLDYNTSVEVKKDRFIYITLVKKIQEE